MGQLARVLLWAESVVSAILGVLLVAGGLVVLGGGAGLPGVINVDEPGFGHGIGLWAVAIGIGVLVMSGWGIWTGVGLRRNRRAARVSAFVYCAVWILIGAVWIVAATTPIPGAVTAIVNVLILVGFLAWSRASAPSGHGR
jgi:hypothetical protein